MEKEIKCPHCGKVFKVDESEYNSILTQVRNQEFDAEVERRMDELHKRVEAEQKLAASKAEQDYEKRLGKKDAELLAMQTQIAQLKSQLESIGAQKEAEQIKAVAAKETEIAKLRLENEQQQRTSKEQLATAKEQYEKDKRMLEEMIEQYKDLRSKLNNKLVGETLEQHCSIQFEQYLRPVMPHAEFGKDNTAVEGTKGDFIFRDWIDGLEYISAMFEMKNEMDASVNKHKNDDFLRKLDEDRRKKGCEYAILVSTLEPDNEYYNNGIVSKEHLYPKMFVIRPQFFVPMIQLLVGMAKNNVEDKKKLQAALDRNVDVTNFENKLDEFKRKFGKHVTWYNDNLTDALAKIDTVIGQLQKVKDSLITSAKQLDSANNNLENLDIDKMTKDNATMKALFAEARNADKSDL